MKSPKTHWAFLDSKTPHAERMSSLMFFFFEFVQKADEEDVDTMLRLLCDWSEAEDVPCWFTACIFNWCGVGALRLDSNHQPLTLTQLRDALRKQAPGPARADFVAMHLDLRTADKYERAFLALSQTVYREAHGSGKPINAADVLHKATNVALDDVIRGSRRRKAWPTRSDDSGCNSSRKKRAPRGVATNTAARFCPTEGHGSTINWRYDLSGNCEVCNGCNSRVVKLPPRRRKAKH